MGFKRLLKGYDVHATTGPWVHGITGPRAQELVGRTVDSRPEAPMLGRSDIEDPYSQAVEGKSIHTCLHIDNSIFRYVQKT